jgi:hypothetical protein
VAFSTLASSAAAAAVQFHPLADDHPLMTVPAVVRGAAAGVALVGFELE